LDGVLAFDRLFETLLTEALFDLRRKFSAPA